VTHSVFFQYMFNIIVKVYNWSTLEPKIADHTFPPENIALTFFISSHGFKSTKPLLNQMTIKMRWFWLITLISIFFLLLFPTGIKHMCVFNWIRLIRDFILTHHTHTHSHALTRTHTHFRIRAVSSSRSIGLTMRWFHLVVLRAASCSRFHQR